MIGVGTVTEKKQVKTVASWGVAFALSPVNPKGFVKACHKRGIISIPGAGSPQEFFDAKRQGAKTIKLFPSNLWNPEAIKTMVGVGPMGQLNIIATGAIAPENVPLWLQAGCIAVAMGSLLAGQDIKYQDGEAAFVQAQKEWKEGGKEKAETLFRKFALPH